MNCIKLHPYIGIKASQNKLGGAYRVYSAARGMNNGSGGVKRVDLVAQLLKLEAHPENIRRWINDAIRAGIFTHQKDTDYLKYKSLDQVAIICGANYLYWPVIVDRPERLFQKGWKALVWAGFIATLERDKPISREALEAITGVPITTQIRHQESGYIKVTKGVINRGKNHYRAHTDNRYYTDSEGNEIERIANVYTTDTKCSGIRKAPKKGSVGKYRRRIKAFLARQGKPEKLPYPNIVHIYYKSLEGAKNAASRDRDEKRVFTHRKKGVAWYQAVSYA